MRYIILAITFFVTSTAFSAVLVCNQLVPSKGKRTSEQRLVEMREFISETQPTLENHLIDLFVEEQVRPEHAGNLDPLKNVFECRICRLVSEELKGRIELEFPEYEIQVVGTKSTIFNTKFRHVYLVIKNFYKGSALLNRDLFIDGTIRQFFHQSAVAPDIFVGPKTDLLKLFYELDQSGENIDMKYFDVQKTKEKGFFEYNNQVQRW